MATPHLQLRPEDCSSLGLLILEQIEKHKLTFSEIAASIGISRAALRSICLKNNNITPGKKTVPRLAKALSISESHLCYLIYEEKVKQMYPNSEYLAISTLDAIERMVEIFSTRLENNFPQTSTTQYELYSHAFKSITKFD
ncbi:helix-turn-helix transcriptional regulator [Myxosarcina sp. GI1]|uniref:helix-turn-helix domain-containing protein n=1 Tax=Myxosarcina sp. GI1 TaxID=1541065 RepID=UPI00056764E7|nr:helix-turn-helix transcriptional regulator [Myxosarcina sp. GI1]